MEQSYSQAEIDQLCSLQLPSLQECSLQVLRKIAKDVELEGTSAMNKAQLCAKIKMKISLASSARLINKCVKQIQGLELFYDPRLHGAEVGRTIQQLKAWYNDHAAKIDRLRANPSERSIFELSTLYAEINSQCPNLVNGIVNQALTYARRLRR